MNETTKQPKSVKRTAEAPFAARNCSVVVEIIQGVEGPCVVINDRRVAGPKPWGGGKVIMRWKTTRDQIIASLPSDAFESRVLDEVRVQFGAIERLLRAGIVNQKQIGKARAYARRRVNPPNND